MNEDTQNFVLAWIEKANNDLIVVNKLTEFEIVAGSAVCFHAQQIVEKMLKAYLVGKGKEIRKTHSIEYLLEICSEIDTDFSNINPKNLSDFAVDIRYPGDFYQPGDSEVLEYKQMAIEIKNMVETKLNIQTL